VFYFFLLGINPRAMPPPAVRCCSPFLSNTTLSPPPGVAARPSPPTSTFLNHPKFQRSTLLFLSSPLLVPYFLLRYRNAIPHRPTTLFFLLIRFPLFFDCPPGSPNFFFSATLPLCPVSGPLKNRFFLTCFPPQFPSPALFPSPCPPLSS